MVSYLERPQSGWQIQRFWRGSWVDLTGQNSRDGAWAVERLTHLRKRAPDHRYRLKVMRSPSA
jgi:hypothetical protein